MHVVLCFGACTDHSKRAALDTFVSLGSNDEQTKYAQDFRNHIYAKTDEMIEEIRRKKEELEQARESGSDRVASMETNLAALNSEFSGLVSRINANAGTLGQMKKDMKEFLKAVADANAKLAEVTMDLDVFGDGGSSEEKARCVANLAEAQERLNSFKNSCKKTVSEQKENDNKKEELEQKIAQLQEQIEAAKTLSVGDLEEEIKRLEQSKNTAIRVWLRSLIAMKCVLKTDFTENDISGIESAQGIDSFISAGRESQKKRKRDDTPTTEQNKRRETLEGEPASAENQAKSAAIVDNAWA